MAAGFVFDLDDPDIRIELHFLHETLFHSLLGNRLGGCRRKCPVGRMAVVISGLRRRRKKQRGAVKQRELDEHRTRLLGAAPAHRAKYSFGLASPQIRSNPDG